MVNLRNFFIAFFVSLIVFAATAWILVDKLLPEAGNPDEGDNEVMQTINKNNNPAISTKKEDGESLTGLLCCYDELTGRADAIILLNINENKNTFSICNIPSYLKIDVGSVSFEKNVYLGDIMVDSAFDEPKKKFKSTVESVTGLKINNYAFLSSNDFVKIINEVGGIDYTVPMDMRYEDADGNVLVNLKKNTDHLNGEQALQLLRFRSYSIKSGVIDDGDSQRRKVQTDFIKAFFDQMLVPEHKNSISGIVESVLKLIAEGDTDFTTSVFNMYFDMITDYPNYTFNVIEYPILSSEFVELNNGEKIAIHTPDIRKAIETTFKSYR